MAKSKFLATVIAAVAFVVLSGAMKVNATPVESGDLVYEVNEETGTATLQLCKGAEREAVVKKTVKLGAQSYPVVAIADEAFALTTVTSVRLPETIQVIGAKAFYRCSYLTEINIPEGLLKVGKSAFAGCMKPAFPEGCEVDESVFSVEEETGDSTQQTGEETGEETKSDDDKVTDPGQDNAADGADGADGAKEKAPVYGETHDGKSGESVNPTSTPAQTQAQTPAQTPAQTQQAQAQQAQAQQAQAQVAAAVTVDTFSLNGSTYELFSDGTAVLKKVSLLKKSLRVPNSVAYQGKKYKVTRIAKNAAKGCDRLVKVTLKGNLKEIGSGAFRGCKKLQKVNVKNVTKIGAKAFYGCKRLKSVSSNGKVTSVGKKCFGKCSKKLDVTGLLR